MSGKSKLADKQIFTHCSQVCPSCAMHLCCLNNSKGIILKVFDFQLPGYSLYLVKLSYLKPIKTYTIQQDFDRFQVHRIAI